MIIVIDSFKYLSRNFEKNLKVLEFILTHDTIFLTNNYLIANDYVLRRCNLVCAMHGDGFNLDAIRNIGEVSMKYANNLEILLQQKYLSDV